MAIDIRQILQELVVPELKEIRGAVDRVHVEIHRLDEKTDAFRSELGVRVDSLRNETVVEIRRLDEKIGGLDGKLTEAIDIRERLAALEARMDRR